MRKVSLLIGTCMLVALALTLLAQTTDLSPIMKDVAATSACCGPCAVMLVAPRRAAITPNNAAAVRIEIWRILFSPSKDFG